MVVYLSAQGKKKKQTVFLNALLCISGLLKYGHNWGFQNEGDNSVQLRDYLNSTIFFFIYWYFRAIKYNKPCSNRRGAVTISCPPAPANQKTEDMTLARLSTVTLTKFCVEFDCLILLCVDVLTQEEFILPVLTTVIDRSSVILKPCEICSKTVLGPSWLLTYFIYNI